MKLKRLNFVDRIRESTVRNGLKGSIMAVSMALALIHSQDSGDGNPFCWIPGLCKTVQAAEPECERPKERVMPLVFPGHGKGPEECQCYVVAHGPHDLLSFPEPCGTAKPTARGYAWGNFKVLFINFNDGYGISFPASWPWEWKCNKPQKPFAKIVIMPSGGHWTEGHPLVRRLVNRTAQLLFPDQPAVPVTPPRLCSLTKP